MIREYIFTFQSEGAILDTTTFKAPNLKEARIKAKEYKRTVLRAKHRDIIQNRIRIYRNRPKASKRRVYADKFPFANSSGPIGTFTSNSCPG